MPKIAAGKKRGFALLADFCLCQRSWLAGKSVPAGAFSGRCCRLLTQAFWRRAKSFLDCDYCLLTRHYSILRMRYLLTRKAKFDLRYSLALAETKARHGIYAISLHKCSGNHAAAKTRFKVILQVPRNLRGALQLSANLQVLGSKFWGKWIKLVLICAGAMVSAFAILTPVMEAHIPAWQKKYNPRAGGSRELDSARCIIQMCRKSFDPEIGAKL